jgi:hypothetical protein
MAFRKKIYYPDNQIIKDLYTKGKEWMYLDDWKEYTGFYHRYTTGEVFTEKEWDPFRSKKLTEYIDKESNYLKYLDLKHYVVLPSGKTKVTGIDTDYFNYTPPTAVRRQPTGDELKDGIMKRYFVYKRNEPNRVFFEIDEKQVKTYETQGKGVNQFIYGLLQINWKITGIEFDVYDNNNILIEAGVVDTNRRIVLRNSKKFPILAKTLTNYREFSKYDGYK